MVWLLKACLRLQRRYLHARDLRRINAAADRLNAECLDVIEDQATELS
jgi:hypothetical protein